MCVHTAHACGPSPCVCACVCGRPGRYTVSELEHARAHTNMVPAALAGVPGARSLTPTTRHISTEMARTVSTNYIES